MEKSNTITKADNIKAFFFDNDSTVFNHSGIGKNILDSTYDALKRLKAKGYKICMITSRGYDEMYNVPSDFLDLFDDLCLLSGGYIISCDKTVVLNPLDKESTRKIINMADQLDVTYRYATSDGGGYLNRHDDSKEAIFKNLYNMVPPIKKYEGEEVLHVLIYADEPLANNIYDNIKNVEYSHVGLAAEYSALGTDKGVSLEKMCKKYGISINEACAFGDSGNDVSMFNKAGLAICLGNGSDVAKENADYITDNIWEDGVYNALKRFGFID